MKKAIPLLMSAILCFALAACAAPPPIISADAASPDADTPDLQALDTEETYPDTPAALAEIYTSLDELINAAEYIAEVEVMSTKVVPLDGLPRTHSQAKVTTALKGELEEGSIIEVIEEGSKEAYLGVPPMESGSCYILFLTEYDGAYYILGAYQGKFIEKEGYVFQQSTAEVKMAEYSPLTVGDFISRYGENG